MASVDPSLFTYATVLPAPTDPNLHIVFNARTVPTATSLLLPNGGNGTTAGTSTNPNNATTPNCEVQTDADKMNHQLAYKHIVQEIRLGEALVNSSNDPNATQSTVQHQVQQHQVPSRIVIAAPSTTYYPTTTQLAQNSDTRSNNSGAHVVAIAAALPTFPPTLTGITPPAEGTIITNVLQCNEAIVANAYSAAYAINDRVSTLATYRHQQSLYTTQYREYHVRLTARQVALQRRQEVERNALVSMQSATGAAAFQEKAVQLQTKQIGEMQALATTMSPSPEPPLPPSITNPEMDENSYYMSLVKQIADMIYAEINSDQNKEEKNRGLPPGAGMAPNASEEQTSRLQLLFQSSSMIQCATQSQAVMRAVLQKGPMESMSLTQIDRLARVQAETIVNNTHGGMDGKSRGSTGGKQMNPPEKDLREKEMKIKLQEQALFYAHKLNMTSRDTLLDPNLRLKNDLTKRRAELNLRRQRLKEELANDATCIAQVAEVTIVQDKAAQDYNHSASQHLVNVHAMRPPQSATFVESTETQLLANQKQQVEGFIEQLRGLAESFNAKVTAFSVNFDDIENYEGEEIVEVDPVKYQASLKIMLEDFWEAQDGEMDELEIGTEQEFKTHNDLPLARIKRIMKSDEDVRMISAEAPVLFAKACEMFVLELTLRSWCHAEQSKRRTLLKEDVQTSIKKTEVLDFLVDCFEPLQVQGGLL